MARQGHNDKEEPIDFAWLTYIGMTKLGFTFSQVGQMTLGFWTDLFETYKKQYNFETKRGYLTSNECKPK